MQTLVLGIGNTLLADEGIGIHAIRHLQDFYADLPNVQYVDGGTLSFTLANTIEMADTLIVIDAAQLSAEAGTFKIFIANDMDKFLNSQRKLSVHEVGLIDLMTICRLVDHLPTRRALCAIQPQTIDWSEVPSAQVQAVLPQVCQQLVDLIKEWRK